MNKTFEERVNEAKAKVPAISARDAYQQRRQQPDVIFVDPRGASDIQSTTGMIPDALNVTLYELSATEDRKLPEALSNRSRAIITACQAGPMGALAAYALKQRGYTNVRFLEGGTQAWLDAGFSTVK
jgi:rhodanese-related sulfurtransferase